MPEVSKGLDFSEYNNPGSDNFSFYACKVAEFLFRDEDFLPFLSQSSDLGGIVDGVSLQDGNNYKLEQNNCSIGISSLFFDAVGCGLSDYRKERLKGLLQQSVGIFTREIDEVRNPVFSIQRIHACLKLKKSLISHSGAACQSDTTKHPNKKHKCALSSIGIHQYATHVKCGSFLEVDKDLLYILENDNAKVVEMMKKYSDELSKTLVHMEQKIEEILNTIMSSCRTMTQSEKQQLRQLVQKLPTGNLNRVKEIVQHNKTSEEYSFGEILVDLEKEDNITLWRLYYFVRTVENARNLCTVQTQETPSASA